MEALQTSGYVKPGATAAAEEKLRRLIRRQNMTSTDAELWLGMLRQILWKVKSSPTG